MDILIDKLFILTSFHYSMLILGIDDAGRGPVIGPMLLAGVLVDSEIEKEFIKMGIKDSKTILPRKRSMLAEEIKNNPKSLTGKYLSDHKKVRLS